MMKRTRRLSPRIRQCHYGLIMIWVLAQPALALAELSSPQYQDRFGEAHSLAQQGDLAGAAAIYRELIQQAPQQPAAFNNLAAIRARQGMLEEAQSLLEQALRNHPDYAAVYENLSAVYVEMARDSYGKALRLDAPPKAVTLRELKTATLLQPAATQLAAKSVPAAVLAPPAAPAKTEIPAPTHEPAAQVSLVTDPPAAAAIDKEAVITTLQGWAAAWSEQAVEVYLLFYAPDYRPDDMSRQNWEAQRRTRLQAPQWIRVELSDIEVTPIQADLARVRLIQEYHADNYQDRTRKEFRLRLSADGWRITQEDSIRRLD